MSFIALLDFSIWYVSKHLTLQCDKSQLSQTWFRFNGDHLKLARKLYSSYYSFIRSTVATVECAALSILLYYAFTPVIIASEKAITVTGLDLQFLTNRSGVQNHHEISHPCISWCTYLYLLCSFSRWSCGAQLLPETSLMQNLIDHGSNLDLTSKEISTISSRGYIGGKNPQSIQQGEIYWH